MLTSAINRAHQRARNDEGGFTLIELLVVVIIIGILAAIAIPTFLNQRKKGWEAAVKSDLRNYAIAMETHFTENSTYLGTTAAPLPTPVESDKVQVAVGALGNSATTYCIEGYHESNSSEVWSLKPGGGANGMKKAACTA